MITAACIGVCAHWVRHGDGVRDALLLLACLAWIWFGCVQAAKRAGRGWSGWWGLVTAIPLVQFAAWIVFLAVRCNPAGNRHGPVPRPVSSRGRIWLWGQLVVVILLVLAGGAFFMLLFQGVAHMNGR